MKVSIKRAGVAIISAVIVIGVMAGTVSAMPTKHGHGTHGATKTRAQLLAACSKDAHCREILLRSGEQAGIDWVLGHRSVTTLN